YDLLQPVPECVLEAHARFVASHHDRALDDRRFHEDTPKFPSFDGIAFSAMARLRSGPHSPPIDPIFGGGLPITPPARIPGQLTSSFLSGSAGTAILLARSQIVWQCDRLATDVLTSVKCVEVKGSGAATEHPLKARSTAASVTPRPPRDSKAVF